ncbi:MAG: hypothetical protein LIP03_11880 [Bacteroidales bacterium]|nr:hypothetical protein [Bacteroidales bacterium]
MRRLLSILSIASALVSFADDSANYRTWEHSQATDQAVDFVYGKSSVNRFWQYSSSLSEISAGYQMRREDQAAETWNGDGLDQGYFDAQAYVRMGKNGVAYAGAGYEYGEQRNVVWNSTADYEMLYPYILADSVGGDLRREQYHFYGGFAHRGGEWVYGLSGSYRAVHSYRQVDPRPRNMATDLEFELSAARILGRYALGVAAGARFYKQVLDVEYFSQTGANSTQFQMTGLGQTYRRFDGVTYTETRHKGFGFNGEVSLLPTDGNGLFALARFSQLKMDRQIHELNEAPITRLWTHRLSAALGIKRQTEAFGHALALEGAYERRQGEEAVVDNGYLGSYEILDRHTLYDSHRYEGSLKWALQWQNDCHRVSIVPQVTAMRLVEQYIEPWAEMKRTEVLPGLLIDYQHATDAWLFQIGAQGSWRKNLDTDFSVPARHVEQEILAKLSYDHERATADAVLIRPYAMAQRAVGQGAVFLKAEYQRVFSDYGLNHALHISIGYRF